MKLVLKYGAIILAVPVGILLLVAALLYIPPVQRFAVRQVCSAVSDDTLQVSVDDFRLRFPLTLDLGGVVVLSEDDTLCALGRGHVEIEALPLLRLAAVISELSLHDVCFNYADTSGFSLRVKLGEAALLHMEARLRTEMVDAALLRLADGAVSMRLGRPASEPAPADTAASEPLAWRLAVQQAEIDNIAYGMEGAYDESFLSVAAGKIGIDGVAVDLGRQSVDVALLQLHTGEVEYLTDPDTAVPAVVEPVPSVEPDTASLPWTIRALALRLDDTQVKYARKNYSPHDGFDADCIQLSDVTLSLDSVYNCGSAVAAQLRTLSLQERSGLRVCRGEAAFSMDSAAVKVAALQLATEHSVVSAEVDADGSVLSMDGSANLSAELAAAVGIADAVLFDPSLAATAAELPFESLLLELSLDGALDDLRLHRLSAELPHCADMLLSGEVKSLTFSDSLAAHVDMSARLDKLSFVPALLDSSLRARVAVPDSMRLSAQADFSNGRSASAHLGWTVFDGTLSLDAGYLFPDTAYRAAVEFSAFPLSEFLPHDSLGLLSMSLAAEGCRFDPFSPNMKAVLDLQVDTLDYGGYRYENLSVALALDTQALSGHLQSEAEALRFDMALQGRLTADESRARLSGAIDHIDLKTLRFTDDSITFASSLDATAAMNASDEYTMKLRLDSTAFRLLDTDFALDSLAVAAGMWRDSLDARLALPGVDFAFAAPAGIDTFLASVMTFVDTLSYAVDAKKIAPAVLCDALPPFALQAGIVPEQAVEALLRMNDVQLSTFDLAAGHGEATPLFFDAEAVGSSFSSLKADTLKIALQQNSDTLHYALHMGNTPETSEMLASAGIGGYLAPQELFAALRQRNQEGVQSLLLDMDASLSDTTARVSLAPEHPVLGVAGWTLNTGNYIEWFFDGHLAADLLLERESQRFALRSDEALGGKGISLDIRNFDVAPVLALVPSAPPVDTRFSADISAGFAGKYPLLDAALRFDSTQYDGNYLGNLGLTAAYRQPSASVMEASAELSVDSVETLTAALRYDTDTLSPAPVAAEVHIADFPVRLANAFVSDDMLKVEGLLHGDISMKGAFDAPHLTGALSLTGGKVAVPMTGSRFRLEPVELSFRDDKAFIDSLLIYGTNNSPLSIKGSADISDFSRPYLDASVVGKNFRLFETPKNKTSMLYGVADADIDISARGYTDALVLRGDVELLNGTEATYVLRDNNSLPGVSDYGDMVTFTAFADTLEVDSLLPLRKVSGMDMQVNIDIGNAVALSVELTPDGNSYVDLQGGGSLTYTMNTLGDSRFTGCYELSGGTVCYSIPLIGDKLFTIKEGSSVAWAGDIAAPVLDITATDKIQVSVSSGNTSRTVQFDVSITLANSLEDLSIIFDVAAPNDLTIQNELSSMTAEQRATQAMGLLVYNMYTGPSSSQGSLFSGNPLNQFLQNELNKWSRNNLKNVELSFGIDSQEEADGTTRTDYSYQLSKKLFNDRVRIVIGGSYSPDDDSSDNLKQNLIEDIALEYYLDKRDNMLVKLFRHTGQESILEGEVTKTGVGFAVKKKLAHLRELFRRSARKKQAAEKEKQKP